MDALLFWLPSVKASRQLWERGQALWTEQMTAALSGPCADCHGASQLRPRCRSDADADARGGPRAAPTAYLPYEPNRLGSVRSPGMPSTAHLPVHDDEGEARTSAMPAYSDYTASRPPAERPPPRWRRRRRRPCRRSRAASAVRRRPRSRPTAAGAAPSRRPGGDEHESHTVILSSLPSIRAATRLVVLEGPVRGRQFSLGRDRTTIGRSIGCHVTVEADAVEYDHAHRRARRATAGRSSRRAARPSLHVNDEPVQGSRALQPGDVIRIGPARLRFESVS